MNEGGLTARVTCVWAGVDSVWEQEKLEAREMLENAAESPASSAPSIDSGQLFSTEERPVLQAEKARKSVDV